MLEYHALHKYIMNQYKEKMTNVLLIDEVQMCPQFDLQLIAFMQKESMIFILQVLMRFYSAQIWQHCLLEEQWK